jgi:hypothetical protein
VFSTKYLKTESESSSDNNVSGSGDDNGLGDNSTPEDGNTTEDNNVQVGGNTTEDSNVQDSNNAQTNNTVQDTQNNTATLTATDNELVKSGTDDAQSTATTTTDATNPKTADSRTILPYAFLCVIAGGIAVATKKYKHI